MLTIEKLREYGADVDEGLTRCLGKEDFYLRMVDIALSDKGFDKLKDAVAANDLTAGFEAAHALKGMLGNLALTPLCTPIYEITELLRARTEMDYTPLVNTIMEQYQKLVSLAQ